MQFIDFKVPIIIHTSRMHTKCAGRDNNSQIQKNTSAIYIYTNLYNEMCTNFPTI